MSHRLRVFTLLLLLVPAGWAAAQGTITDGAATFALTGTPFDASPTGNLTGVSPTPAQDHLFETGWWFRLSGGTSETFFPAPTTQNYVGNTATLTWSSLGGGLFSASQTIIVTNTTSSGHVSMAMTITNLSGAPLGIDLFHMADFDLQPTAGDDTAALVSGNNHISLDDAGTNAAQYRGLGASAFLVRPFSGAGTTDVAGLLSDAALTNFDNTSLPFGPGDFTGGFQWTATIPVAGQQTFTATLAVNTTVTPVELTTFSAD